jgi:hypothetical protein
MGSERNAQQAYKLSRLYGDSQMKFFERYLIPKMMIFSFNMYKHVGVKEACIRNEYRRREGMEQVKMKA